VLLLNECLLLLFVSLSTQSGNFLIHIIMQKNDSFTVLEVSERALRIWRGHRARHAPLANFSDI
jgi:hypothetical protein